MNAREEPNKLLTSKTFSMTISILENHCYLLTLAFVKHPELCRRRKNSESVHDVHTLYSLNALRVRTIELFTQNESHEQTIDKMVFSLFL